MHQQSDVELPARYFGNRVRLLAEVGIQPDEIALVRAVLQRNDCLLHQPSQGAATADGKTIRIIFDMWLPGSRRFAVRAATKRIEDVAEQAKLDFRVRDAALVDYPRVSRKMYYLYNRPPHRLRWSTALATVQAWSSKIGTSRLIQVHEAIPEGAVRSELAQRNLGLSFDSTQHSLRVLDDSPSGAPWPKPEQMLWMLGGLIAAIVGGAAIFWVDGAWRIFPLLAIVASTVLVFRAMKSPVLTRRRMIIYACIYSAAFAAIGAFTAGGGGVAGPWHWFGRVLLACIGLLAGWGIVLAARDSWVRRNAAWVVPLTFALLAPTVPWLGGAVQAEYLSNFDIPDSSVPVSAIWRILAGGKPMLIAVGFTLFFISLVGWLRYFHKLLDRDFRWLIFLCTAASVLIYGLGALQIALTGSDAAASQAMAAAKNGREPADYFGLQGTLVCLQPLRPQIPILFGPFPNRPLLFFGANGDRLWAWNPGTGAGRHDNSRVISVALQDVTVIQAVGHPAHCPPGTH